MSTDISFSTRAHEENWLFILELAVEEVFEIMLGCRVKPAAPPQPLVNGEYTAMVGLAGSLCGVLTIRCDAETARQVARSMLGEPAGSEEQVADALGEICNMITGDFDSGDAQMKSTSEAAFDRIASMLRQHDYRLRIEGHTDTIPIHNSRFASNWELSTARATEIVRLLIVRDGFSPSRLSAGGFAEYHPVASNRTAEGRATNRRVDVVVLGHTPPVASLEQAGPQSMAPTAPPGASILPQPSSAVPLKPTAGGTGDHRLQR